MARLKGMKTIRQDGWGKVINGLTTPEEVMNITLNKEHSSTANVSELVSESEANEAISASAVADHRAYSRLEKSINLRYRIFKSKQELIERGFTPEELSVTKDVSGGGLLFISVEALPVDAILELIIELPDGEKPIECLAKVLRVEDVVDEKSYNIAVCFLDITSSGRARMNKFVVGETE